MRYSQIQFTEVIHLDKIIDILQELYITDYNRFKIIYLKFDQRIIDSLLYHRTLNSILRAMDYVPLKEYDFINKDYLLSRLNKMTKGIKYIMTLYKG
jgi:hypothetical protein